MSNGATTFRFLQVRNVYSSLSCVIAFHWKSGSMPTNTSLAPTSNPGSWYDHTSLFSGISHTPSSRFTCEYDMLQCACSSSFSTADTEMTNVAIATALFSWLTATLASAIPANAIINARSRANWSARRRCDHRTAYFLTLTVRIVSCDGATRFGRSGGAAERRMPASVLQSVAAYGPDVPAAQDVAVPPCVCLPHHVSQCRLRQPLADGPMQLYRVICKHLCQSGRANAYGRYTLPPKM